jgi:hypothetical protein
MEIIFKIAKYSKVEDNFVLEGFDEYKINYMFSKNIHHFRIIVNGVLTNVKVSYLPSTTKREKFLKAISDYKNNLIKDKTLVNPKNFINLEKLKKGWHNKYMYHIKQYLLNDKKEATRDTLTEYNLI